MKNTVTNKFVSVILVFLAILTFGSIAYADELRVGVDTAFVPSEFKGKDGKYTGFDVDLWDAIAKRLDIKYKLVPMDFNGLIPGLTTGNLDAESTETVVSLLLDLHRRGRNMLVVVTHNPAVADRFDRKFKLTPTSLQPY